MKRGREDEDDDDLLALLEENEEEVPGKFSKKNLETFHNSSLSSQISMLTRSKSCY